MMNSQGLAVRFSSTTTPQQVVSGLLLMAVLILLAVMGTPDRRETPLSGATPATPASLTPNPAPASSRERIKATFGQLPLYFIENQGQSDPQVAYYVHGADTRVYFTADGLTIAQQEPAPPVQADADQPFRKVKAQEPATPATPRQRWAVKLAFVGAEPVLPQGRAKTEAVVSYFKGPQSQWKTGLPTYTEVVYSQLWPGVDLVYSGATGKLKTTFHVQPGADPQAIQLAYQGATDVTLTDAGRLVVQTPVGRFEEDQPLVYQDIDGERVIVEAHYTLTATGAGEWRYGFRLGHYNARYPLVIDPVLLVYCGYIGGSDFDSGYSIAVDEAGQAYVTGTTGSTQDSFPVVFGPDLTFNGGSYNVYDAFVAKVSADGSQLMYAGYIGGSGDDEGNGIAVDGAGQAYVTGTTGSTQDSFPVTVGPDLTYNSYYDTFVAKVSADGSQLVYAGYIGGLCTGQKIITH